MKPITLMQALFLMLIYFKVTNTQPVPTWFEVFLPLIFEAIYKIVAAYAKVDKWDEKTAFWLWKLNTARKVRKAAKKAAKEVREGNK